MCMMIYIFTVYYIELYFATVFTEISRMGVGKVLKYKRNGRFPTGNVV